MKALKANVTNAFQKDSRIATCDNSGAKLIRIISFKGYKGVKGRKPSGGVGDLITAAVRVGTPEMRKKVVQAIIVRQRKEFKRVDGSYIRFDDNAVVILGDGKEPKGTRILGPVAKELKDKGFATIR